MSVSPSMSAATIDLGLALALVEMTWLLKTFVPLFSCTTTYCKCVKQAKP